MSTLGELLVKLRGNHSLRAAAKKIGISHTYLDIIEKGVDARSGSPVNPTPDTLKAIAKAYNYPYIELMYVAGYVDEAESMGEEINNSINVIEELKGLVERYTDDEIIQNYTHTIKGNKLTESQIKKILSYVRFVLSTEE